MIPFSIDNEYAEASTDDQGKPSAGLMAASLSACSSSGKPVDTTKAAGGETKTESKADESKSNTGSSVISGKTVAFIPKLTGKAFFESANGGAQKYGKSWGITVDYQGRPMRL